MVQTIQSYGVKELKGKLVALHSVFSENNDGDSNQKAKQLAEKLNNHEFAIAFCGHFSAGKSSMINRLVGENLLPSSPIPTSANLVKVKKGEEYAKVYFKQGKTRLYPAPYDYEKVKSFAKDGDKIDSVEISHAHSNLPENTAILDTPGIDSTDDAHRIATESALHLADLIFYVMDYNHVQSELNFIFTKELITAGKELYLIINQVDKHRDEELSFEYFTKSVRDAFAAWGVYPERIFYTSLKDDTNPHNELKELQLFIHQKLADREQLLPKTIFHSLKKVSNDHLELMVQQDDDKREEFVEKLASLTDEDIHSLPSLVSTLKTKLKEVMEQSAKYEQEFDFAIDDLLQNAYLMPFQTRELAERYLQARQPDFKVGLFFAKQKTEQERGDRLEQFYTELTKTVDAQITWHLKDLLLRILKEHDIRDSELLAYAQGYTFSFPRELLSETVKTGAMLSGDYVLNYTNDVANEIKKQVKRELVEMKPRYLEALNRKNAGEQKQLEQQLQKAETDLANVNSLNEIDEKREALKERMTAILSETFSFSEYEGLFAEMFTNIEEDIEIIIQMDEESEERSNVKSENRYSTLHVNENEQPENREQHESGLQKVIERLTYTANELQPIPGFAKLSGELLEKADRLNKKGFTVALFGAFSAGKSSFANALMGEKILPVSPNPTTAAINKIMPVDEQNPHGTARVKLKDPNRLFEDVANSLKIFNYQAANFDEALEKTAQLFQADVEFDPVEKTHFAFLHAFSQGFPQFRNELGNEIIADLEGFRDFVANEQKSCLVDYIEVYFDCELTRKGITLVDTPGADSINARHTGVAFEYIKNSDAILFVTYYNHAFSKADREFLIQLGRVKDSFELDKMFFIVNAIDLANDEEEMNDVMEYVEDQLVTYGIRKPHLFPISSLQAIHEKLEKADISNSGIQPFENQFYSFIANDLTGIAIEAAEGEINRAIHRLQEMIHSSREDQASKEQRKEKTLKEKQSIIAYIAKQQHDYLQKRIEQEADELAFYVKQRVFLRFGDFFKESFNPSVLKDDGRNLKKALQFALDDFLSTIGFDFAQEMRATSLRLEVFLKKILSETENNMLNDMREMNDTLDCSKLEIQNIEGIEFNNAFVNIGQESFKKAMTYFKNPKTFFEKNEKKLMCDELENVLEPHAVQYIETEKVRLQQYYTEVLRDEFARLKQLMTEQIEEHYEGILAALTNNIPIERLVEAEKRLIQQG